MTSNASRRKRKPLHKADVKMTNHILKCKSCGKYTMHEKCACGGEAVPQIPAKYSPEDPYGKYRREAKKEMLKEKGLL